jgi:prepilin-type N-terminal cleavage/methylation domain-containing protein
MKCESAKVRECESNGDARRIFRACRYFRTLALSHWLHPRRADGGVMMKCESAKVRECESNGDARRIFRACPYFRTFALSHSRTRLGFTLIELMVVLVILGVMASVVGLAARSLDDTDPAAERAARIADARRRALHTRRPVVLQLDSARRMVAFPDGSVRADTALGLDELTGRPRAK